MLVAVQLSVPGLYLPPVSKALMLSTPPQTITSLPVHTAVSVIRAAGALVMLVAVHVSVLGLYRPPVFKPLPPSYPPQTIISLPVHTAEALRAVGALVVLVTTQVSSMQPPEGLAIAGSVYEVTPRFVARKRFSVEAAVSAANSFVDAGDTPVRFVFRAGSANTVVPAARRSARTGLAKHSAMTKGSFPRASNSSCKTSGCLVWLAMRSSSACS